MQTKTTDTSQTLDQSFINQSYLSNLTASCKRISRKTDQTNATRRSLSRHSSQRSIDKPQLNNFFIKMSTLQKIGDSSTRNSILNRQQKYQDKKRQATPVPGIISRRKQLEREKAKKQLQFENQLMISDLQKRLKEQKERSSNSEKRVQLLEQDLKTKNEQIQTLIKHLQKAAEKEKELNEKLEQYQSVLKQNQNNLFEARSSLERIKNNIKISRISQLESNNLKLNKDNDKLRIRISEILEENREIEQRCVQLERQAFASKKKDSIKFQKIDPENSNLQNMLHSRDKYTNQLEARIAKLQIQLNCLNRKKAEEMEIWRDKKDKQILRIREKLCTISRQLLDYKIENEKLKKLSNSPERPSRLSSHSHMREEFVSLSLSPEHLD